LQDEVNSEKSDYVEADKTKHDVDLSERTTTWQARELKVVPIRLS